MSGFKPFDPNSSSGVGVFQVIAPDDGQTYSAEGDNWVNTLTQAANSLYAWDDDITATDPGIAQVKIDNANESLATNIYMSTSNFNGQDLDSPLGAIDNGDYILLKRYGAQANFIVFKVTGQSIDNGGWFTIPVQVEDNGGGFVGGDQLEFVYLPTSNRAGTIQIERLLDAVSLATTQEPAGQGIANAIQVEFGAASGGALEPYTLSVDGTLTINETGTYRIKVAMQLGRSGSPGVSELLFRVKVNGVQAGRSVSFRISNADDENYFENDNWVNIPATTTIEFEVMRDDAGNDSGGLFAITPTDEGAGTWNPAPTAALRVERWISE